MSSRRSRSRRPGRGFYMDSVVLKNLVLFSFYHSPSELENRFGVSHGVAVRMHKKALSLALTYESAAAMTPGELAAKWYSHKRCKVIGQSKLGYLAPDLAKMQEMYAASRDHRGQSSEVKTELTKASIVKEIYLSEENRKFAKEHNLAMYEIKSVVRKWHQYERKIPVEFRRSYTMGSEIQLDFTGVTVDYKNHGADSNAQIMVMSLPASRYITARAIASQKLDDVIPAIIDCLKELGGVPSTLVVDNFKGAVIKASRYGGIPNQKLSSMCRWFSMELFACRPYRPVDKGNVEASVKIVTRSALALIKYRQKHERLSFNSLKELNTELQGYITEINCHKVRALKKTRKELFDEERKYLRKPDSWEYECHEIYTQTVPPTGVIEIAKHQYALPEKWIGQTIEIELSPHLVRLLDGHNLIESYERRDNQEELSTRPFYTPENILSYEMFRLEQKSFLSQWAARIGEHVQHWCSAMLKRRYRLPEIVKQIVKILSLPDGDTALYMRLNNVIENLSAHPDYPQIATRIITEFNDNKPASCGTLDDIYSLDNYKEQCRKVLYGQVPSLCWPVAAEHKNRLPKNSGCFLQGVESYQSRFGYITKQLEDRT